MKLSQVFLFLAAVYLLVAWKVTTTFVGATYTGYVLTGLWVSCTVATAGLLFMLALVSVLVYTHNHPMHPDHLGDDDNEERDEERNE